MALQGNRDRGRAAWAALSPQEQRRRILKSIQAAQRSRYRFSDRGFTWKEGQSLGESEEPSHD